MKYSHILSAFAAEPWALDREKLSAVTDFLLFKADGGVYAPEEVALRVGDGQRQQGAASPTGVALIPVHGVLSQRMTMMSEISGGTSYQSLTRALHEAIASEDVSAVVMEIDSPGGSVPGAMELAAEIRSLRGGSKPIVAHVNSMAASAAYWIASQADEIVVTPSGRAGSIGVYTVHEEVSAALEKAGVKRTYISSTPEKVEGNETEALAKETLEYIQARVNESYQQFVAEVAEGRGTTTETVLADFGKGRVFGAKELLKRGMADSIATLDQTLARFGAETIPAAVRKIKAENQSRNEAAELLSAKLRSGEPITKREFEHGLKGLVGASNSEAERAARLYLKTDQGDPDETENAAALAALDRLIAEAKAFPTP
jgi:signal peptide peptidase SppA